MVDKICDSLLDKIRSNDPSIDEEKSEIIYYGLQNMIGELPKGIAILIIAAVLGVFKLVLLGSAEMLIYSGFAGGVHLKTHISCLITSTILVFGSTYFAKEFIYENTVWVYTLLFVFNFIMAMMYAPADTENRPIMKEGQMKRQKVESVLMVTTVYIICTFIIKERVLTNLFMYMITSESLMITPLAYKIFHNKYGKERREEILSESM